ncbi:MAG: bifunctional diaminohydroxyphosphoribosylaminopyrimidine deaminase/5-amino-6-(5-phosphoribosylamino)uracil reductase RibD [Phycisphaera sp.]|nr:bifunctional diaminohydroxyphosphoribosylaminopyrimidine deaminase/5-amino-6-(5-phosphoribosylamino)uracil reductase RibD [Phycisphaera sp.]
MNRALRLAARGVGWVEPNPMVGCVIVRDGRALGRGYHRRFGGDHAEVDALKDARKHGHNVRGATVYVTLEPCSHHGKTPPCTDALMESGVGSVYAAMLDPFEGAAGRGVAKLREAGIAVEVGLCEHDAAELNGPYVHRIKTGQPWGIAKWAQSLDGFIALPDGESKWISNEASRRRVHALRSRVDAVMVGIGTVLKDDPLLTARGVKAKRIARRVVVDPALRTPVSSKLVMTCREGVAPLTVAVSEMTMGSVAMQPRIAQMRAMGVEVIALPGLSVDRSELDLSTLMRHLTQTHHATNVLIEGGGKLLGYLFKQDLIQQARVFVAPKILGHGLSPVAVRPPGVAAGTKPFRLHRVTRIEDDVLLDYRLV